MVDKVAKESIRLHDVSREVMIADSFSKKAKRVKFAQSIELTKMQYDKSYFRLRGSVTWPHKNNIN